MEYICLDLEGVLVPEIWSEVAVWSGEDQFNLTTQDLKDYSELMDIRMELVKKLGISMQDIMNVVENMEPFPTAKNFLDWAKDRFQVVIVSDSFYELAWPLIRKLGTPSIICHNLDIKEGQLKGYKLRQDDNKKKVVESLQSLKYKVFASGDSYNDIQMLAAADFGVFFQAPQHIRDEFSSIPGVQSHEELKELFSSQTNYIV
ncbi:MAG: bifunctional phosphoserine phosphatase/homoserine phosphotransferase ThrH [SAR86 cluster bacterium]|jgi:phosphoserine / homoserine phosphotransferase|nr:bifunctional phosphoserine phosphatase/homoserine phosphotransferase ThrH [SAR86 cluster bacterium]